MLKDIDPKILGEKIKKARKGLDFTQEDIANILDVSRTTVTAIEKGTRKIQPKELVTLANALHKDVHDLLRIKQPLDSFQVQFRATYERTKEDNEKINEAIKKFEQLCRNYLELEELVNGKPYQNYPIEYKVGNSNLEKTAESVAIRERSRLGLGDGPVPMLRDMLEQDVGLRIFFIKLPSKFSEMYNYSEYLGGCMAINSDHPEVRRRWSMSHAYAHFLGHRKTTVIDSSEKYVTISQNEQFAEAFAKHFLMPANSIIKKYDDIKKSKDKFTLADLFITSHYYGVSIQAMTRRLEEMKLIDFGTWDKLKSNKLKIQKIRRQLNIEELPQRSDTLPTRYQYLALYAYQKHLITEGQFAKFLRLNRVEARDYVNEMEWEFNDEFELEEPLS